MLETRVGAFLNRKVHLFMYEKAKKKEHKNSDQLSRNHAFPVPRIQAIMASAGNQITANNTFGQNGPFVLSVCASIK